MSKTETDSTSPANHNLSFHSCHLSRTENLPRLVHVSASANTRRVATFRISLHLSGSRGVSGAGSRAGTSSPQCQSGRIQRESCMDTEHRSWFPEILIQVKAFVFYFQLFARFIYSPRAQCTVRAFQRYWHKQIQWIFPFDADRWGRSPWLEGWKCRS